jgi:hypothetical protein
MTILALEAYLPQTHEEGWLGTKHYEPYDLTTRPIVGEYIGWIGLSPPANYPDLSRGLATLQGTR